MQPFSRRSSLPQDYESAPPPRQSVRPQGHHHGQAPVSAIGAPRPRPAPVFHRQAPPPPAYSAYSAYSNDPHASPRSQSPYSQAPYSQAPHSVAPPAPHSLAPVEMNAYAGQPRNYQTDRGVAHTSTTNIKPRPTWRTGAMILLAGVFVGGTFGIGVQARRNAMDEQAAMANAATNVAPVAPPAQALPAVQQQAVAPGPTALQPTPPQAPPQAYAQAPANAGLPPGAIVIPPQQGVVVVPPSGPNTAQAPIAAAQPQPQQPASAQPQAHTQPAVKKTVAWRAPAPATRPAPAAAPEPKEPKETKESKPSAQIAAKVTAPKKEAPEPADPPEPPVKKGGKKGATDAQSVLQDALRETTNTL